MHQKFTYKGYCKANDAYSFALIVYELLIGRKPFWSADQGVPNSMFYYAKIVINGEGGVDENRTNYL